MMPFKRKILRKSATNGSLGLREFGIRPNTYYFIEEGLDGSITIRRAKVNTTRIKSPEVPTPPKEPVT